MFRFLALLFAAWAWCFTPLMADEPRPMKIRWEKNILSIDGGPVEGADVKIWYLEAYCRAGSTKQNWNLTVIPHTTELVSAADDGHEIKLRCKVSDGVIVDHTITTTADTVDFQMVATNPTDKPSEIHWGQPCMRVGGFVGGDKETYLGKCFVFLDGKLERFPTRQWATEALYKPGQVWAAPRVDRNDVNPRPLSELTPSNGLIGCFSKDDKKVLAIAYEPYQELFQGVIACIHSDFRIGGLQPKETKKIRGKLYVLDNDIPALLKRYETDFADQIERAK